MAAIEIEGLDDPRIAAYRDLKDRDARVRDGLFVVEGRGSLRCLLDRSPYRARSVLLSYAAEAALERELRALDPATPVYRASAELLAEIVGFPFHRGCLALGERPAEDAAEALLPGEGRASLVLALEGLADPDNVGVVFRNAMAFGVDAILLSPCCHDPLYRKAIRTSIGASLCVPFARAHDWPGGALRGLRAAGYRVIALDPGGEILGSGEIDALMSSRGARLALIVGTEGAGIWPETLELADLRLRIDMAEGVDSVNVGTATGIALHGLFSRRPGWKAGRPRGEAIGRGGAV